MDSANDLERALGDHWPTVRGELVDLVFRLDVESPGAPPQREADDFLERLLDGPAQNVVRAALARQQQEKMELRGFWKDRSDKPEEPEPSGSLVIPVHYATNRRWCGDDQRDIWYSGERGDLSYGVVEVSVPARHEIGEVEGPKWWKLQFRPDPTKHILLLSLKRFPEDVFLGSVGNAISNGQEAELLVFIHGYNVPFNEAARRAAQIARDLKFPGPTVMYSWPSRGQTHLYTADEASIEASIPSFNSFLQLLLTRVGAERAHLISHSMGARALVRVMDAFDASAMTDGAAKLGHVIFAAPDVDRDVFLQSASTFKGRAQDFTLYASSNDLALKASKLLHQYPRAGDAGMTLVIHEDLDTVDATSVDTSLFGLGHSYFANKRTILNDLYGMILNGLPPSKRFDLEPAAAKAGPYWSYRE